MSSFRISQRLFLPIFELASNCNLKLMFSCLIKRVFFFFFLQNSYYYLLRRYLESIFPGCEARSTFLKLIQKISELHKLNEDHVRVYLDVNPKDIEPLLIEIFDLKPH